MCKCDCGNEIIVERPNLSVNKIRTFSCGCWKKEQFTKHNKCNTKIYNVYTAMKQRCYNPKNPAYKYYGARGIKIYSEWLDKENGFENFYKWAMENGYKNNLSIDRIDNDKDYEPDNCRWVSSLTQMNNTRRNHFIEYNNEIHTIGEWARITGIEYSKLYRKLIIKKEYEVLDKKSK